MDGTRFARLVRAWLDAGTRRAVLRSLASLPLGGLAAQLDREASDAKRRQGQDDDVGAEGKTHKERCRRRKGKGRGHHGQRKSCQARHGKNKNKKNTNKKHPCTPEPTAETCAGRCGDVENTCQETVDCGSCVCDPPCPACQICDAETGQCVPDTNLLGEACGEDGQLCQGEGNCACDVTSCPECTTCADSGVCEDCAGCCAGGACVDACDPCEICDGGLCRGCPDCCDGDGVCQDGDTDTACGSSGTCAICTGQEECQGQQCVCVPNCAGKTCGPDGCGDACGPGCAACETCLGNGTCSDPCGGTGCCAGTSCEQGDTNTACGRNGGPCQVCTGSGATCGGGGQPGVCGCTPRTICPPGLNCGDVADGCGGTIRCGTCTPPETCGGGGTPNVCGCTPLTTCPGGANCGTISDGCGGNVSCGGPCSGTTPLCLSNVCTACGTSGDCVAASLGDLCCSGACVTGICCVDTECAPAGNECVGNQCFCDGGSVCADPTPDCCGAPGSCTNTDTDENNCGACGVTCSGATPLCWDGDCVCGDVCEDGCQFSSLQAAVDATPAGGTITICAGDYLTSNVALNSVTIRGAGAGLTILRGPGDNRVIDTFSNVTIHLHDLTITGGRAPSGGGIFNRGEMTLTRVAVTGNVAEGGGVGGGISQRNGTLTLDASHVTLNQAGLGGGISADAGTVRLTNGSTVTNNTAGVGGGIDNRNSATIVLELGTRVCDNAEPQCTGFTPPADFCGACPT
jgi:hypothetical protein